MKKDELLARINSLSRNAIGGDESELSNDRAEAMDRYHGRPYGDEKEGRSKVVSKDLSETVDWIMPSVMKVFLQSGDVVEFLPVGPEDEDLAKQETDYVNYVMLEQNDGFLYLHDWFKDALLLKNGYVKAYWEERQESTVERYKGLSMDEAASLFQGYEADGAEVEVVSQEERTEEVLSQGMPVPLPVVDLVIRVNRKIGRECIEAIPAEEVRVARGARGKLNDCDYVEHRTRKSRTKLIEMGMDKKFVDGLGAGDSESGDEETSRSPDDSDYYETRDSIDHSMDEIEYREIYCMVDYDDDGKAERRKVVIVANEIPDGDEWNMEIDHCPIYYCTPKRMPHRHVGESLYDELKDLIQIKTVLNRAMLDNTYGQVNQEWLVNERVNLDDFLISRPMGIKRVADKLPVGDCAVPVPKPNILGHVLPVLEHFDRIKANRTGVNPPVTGVDPNVLKEVREKVASDNLDKANAKIEMICRMLAEIGVKDLAKGVHADLMKYQDKKTMFRLRNEWVTVNPQEWRNRTDLSVKVGLGNGNREELKETVRMIAEAQGALAPFNLVGPKQAYNSFVKLTKALGEVNPESYAINPESEEYKQMMQQMSQQQQSNPLAEVEQIKQQSQQQIAQMKEQSRQQIEQSKAKQDIQMELLKMKMEQQKEMAKNHMEMEKAKYEWMMAEQDKKWQRAFDITKLEIQALSSGHPIDIGNRGIGAGLRSEASGEEVIPKRRVKRMQIVAPSGEVYEGKTYDDEEVVH